ncbi:MAG: ferrous iron transport protein B [Oscillospiraceae bacterium]|nr:ferrous iron transport protein B [Oscillospiraceae bacterium]
MPNRTIGLAGNPNCGKTTLFNRLTGARQVTGNWPGVTVERKEGQVKGKPWILVDLPGTYSLASYSPEERVARDFLQDTQPDLVLNVVDATALERNLYLTLQLLEQHLPVVVALNLCDQLHKKGGQVDCKALSSRLGVPVIPISARSGENIGGLINALEQAEKGKGIATSFFAYQGKPQTEQARYAAVRDLLDGIYDSGNVLSSGITEKLDDILTDRYLAIPIFLFIMLLMFTVIFGPPGMYAKGLAEQGVQAVSRWLGTALEWIGASWWAKEMALEGIWAGVGGMLTFLPQMALLFLFLSLLEDSGYMARGAFVMDRLLRKAGLSGKAFIPLLMGFGCTTPAAMATRTLERERERKLTVLMLPFFSCGAKLPVYVLFSAAFFPKSQGLLIFGLYLFGVLLGIFWVRLASGAAHRGEEAPFVMELPPYRLPTLSGILRHLWDKCKGFVVKAGTVIVSLSALMWLMQHVTFSLDWTEQAGESMFGAIGRCLAPLFRPLGFGSWQAAVSLLAGIVAKEAVVSSMASLYACGNAAGLTGALQGAFTPASALSFLVFVLLYMPCVAAFATIRRELGGWRAGILAMAEQTAAAYAVGFAVYRLALLFFPA